MPRLPFQVSCRAAGVIAVVLLSIVHTPLALAAKPTPQITISATKGRAPFTIHVHALNSNLGAGDQNTARYEWVFGDSNGEHNKLVGWSAAHVYNKAGKYTIKLKITNENGEKASVTKLVTIKKTNRNSIFISNDGHDNNPGTSTAPIRTINRANQLMADNTFLRFKRGATYNINTSLHINNRNVLVGTYGSGSRPVLNWTPNSQYNSIITMGENAQDVTVEALVFDTPFQPNTTIARGLQPNGRNITIRNCHFEKISYAVNAELGVNCLMLTNNTAGAIGAYFVWGEGNDHVYLGNTVLNSMNEHNIRLGYVDRLLIARNDLKNTAKSCLWCMLGQNCYIAENTFRKGRVLIGPNFAVGSPGERTRYTVMEGNKILDEGMIAYAGAEQVMVRNNIVQNNGGEAFAIWGWYAPMSRNANNITIVNNTAVNYGGQTGRFLKVGDGASDLRVCNNLYVATDLDSASPVFAANVFSDDNSLNSLVFRNNMWANPANGQPRHFVGGSGKSVAQWQAMSETYDDLHRNCSNSDLSSAFVPQFNAKKGKKVAGVFVDFNKKPRPTTGNWVVGAIE